MTSRRILAAPALLCALSAPAQAQSSMVTISPTPGTANQGLVINQTLPSSGLAAGPLLLNSITATNTGLGTSGSGWDSFGQIRNQINALRINYATASTNAPTTERSASRILSRVPTRVTAARSVPP